MRFVRMLRDLFRADPQIDANRPTDQEVTERLAASLDASRERRAERAHRVVPEPSRKYNAVERRYLGGRRP